MQLYIYCHAQDAKYNFYTSVTIVYTIHMEYYCGLDAAYAIVTKCVRVIHAESTTVSACCGSPARDRLWYAPR